jgi:hypothetical protein
MFEFSKMKVVFKDASLQEQFEKDGYVIVDFYNEQEVKEATDLYYKIHPKNEKGFYPATYSFDKKFRDEMDKGLKKVGSRSINDYLADIKVVCASYIVKTPGPDSGMSIHQDMSLVDESKYTGINIWVPLIDLTVKNGTLFILPGSHRIFPTYRGSSIREFFSDVMDDMIDYLHPVYVKAGQAVIFDQSIIHYSPPNFSDEIRIVTNTYFCHKDTEFRTYFWDNTTEEKFVEGFVQDDNFMLDYEQFGANLTKRPTIGKSLGLIPYSFPRIDKAFLESRFQKTDARKLVNEVVPPSNIAPTTTAPQATHQNIFQRILAYIR